MSLEDEVKEAIERLRTGQLNSEEQVKLAVILPILRQLGWDEKDSKAFRPEFPVDNRKVDIALLDRGRPRVFVEAKRPGGIDASAETQLFEYASNKGIPILVLTDGHIWDFYLSMAEGEPGERKFGRIELRGGEKAGKCVSFLLKHLARDRVLSGEARREAEARLEKKRQRELATQAIPGAWESVLRESNDALCNLVAEQVERECGGRPGRDEIRRFLRTWMDARRSLTRSHKAPSESKSQDQGIGLAGGRMASSPGASQKELEGVVLEALCDMDGSGRSDEVVDRVGQMMFYRLGESDRERLQSGEVRWKKNTNFARLQLVKKGLMKAGSPRGFWEISESGRKLVNG